MSKSREQLNVFLSEVDIEGKLCLDIGVQDKPTSRLTQGTPSKYLTLDIEQKWSPDIVADLNESWAEWSTHITKDNFTLLDRNGGFDVIFCIETLEHCWNPIQAVQNMSGVLKEGGDLYISVPFIGPHHDFVDYLRFTHEWFEEVLPKCDLEIIKIGERVATLGRADLIQFFTKEHMRVSKIRPEYGHYTYPVGYFVHAKRNIKADS